MNECSLLLMLVSVFAILVIMERIIQLILESTVYASETVASVYQRKVLDCKCAEIVVRRF